MTLKRQLFSQEFTMQIKKTTILAAISLCITACSTLPEHSTLQSARNQYESQIKKAGFVQSYLNVPETSIQQYVWWSTTDKVKERDLNVNACLHNARLYNRLAPKFNNLDKSWLPKQLDESRCLPTCDGDSKIDKTCYKGELK